MTIYLRDYRRSLALIGVACLCLVLAAGTYLFATVGPATQGSTIVLPVWPGRSLSINVWVRESVATFWPDASGSAVRGGTRVIKNPGSVTIALWFQNRVAASTTRLAILRIPPWPLLVLAAICIVAAYLLRPTRRHHAPEGTGHSVGA